MNLKDMIHDPLVLFVLGAMYVLGRDILTGALRRDAHAKLADADPKNDGAARAELAIADAVERLPGGGPRAK